jgi:hypothetical protein
MYRELQRFGNVVRSNRVNWNVKILPVQGSSGTEAVVVRAYGYVLSRKSL